MKMKLFLKKNKELRRMKYAEKRLENQILVVFFMCPKRVFDKDFRGKGIQ